MKKYFYRVIYNSEKRGYNRTICVYNQNREGNFNFIGEDEKINTASFKGNRAIASKILHDEFGYKWLPTDKGYKLMSKNIKLIELP